jgi:hypothetical protein
MLKMCISEKRARATVNSLRPEPSAPREQPGWPLQTKRSMNMWHPQRLVRESKMDATRYCVIALQGKTRYGCSTHTRRGTYSYDAAT